MKRDVELAKKLLESKGYKVSKKMNEAGWMVNHPGYDPIGAPAPYNPTTDDEPEPHWVAHNRAEIEKLRKSQGAPADAIYDGESGYFEDPKNPDHFWDEKAKAYNWVFIDGKGWVNESTEYSDDDYDDWQKGRRNFGPYDYEDEEPPFPSADMDETKKSAFDDSPKYVCNTNGYSCYRKIEGNKGVWFAKRQDDPDDKMFPISYEQARGYEEMPDETEIEKLQREIGKLLLPKNEAADGRFSPAKSKYYDPTFTGFHSNSGGTPEGAKYKYDRKHGPNDKTPKPKTKDVDEGIFKKKPKSGDQMRDLAKSAQKDVDDVKAQMEKFKKLNKTNESTDDRQQRRIVKSIAEEVIRSKGQNNSTGTYDRFIRKMMDNWATSGQDRDFIKSAIEKSFDKEYGKKGVNESCRPRRRVKETYDPNYGDQEAFDNAVDFCVRKYTQSAPRSKSTIIEEIIDNYGSSKIAYAVVEKLRAQGELKESSDTPHTESYKGYSIQSYNDYGATVYKNGKKVQEFENIDDAREYIDGLNESNKTLKGALMNSLKRLHESSGLDYEDMRYWNPTAIGSEVAKYLGTDATQEEIESEIANILDRDDPKFQRAVDKALREIEWDKESMSNDPMNGNHYKIGGSTPNVTEYGTDYDVHDGGYADDPELAIIKWLRLSKNSPTMISIDTNKNAYAQELLQWVLDNEEKFRKLCQKYDCPYKIDYMIDGCRQKLQRPSNFETKYNYPDQIWPFALG